MVRVDLRGPLERRYLLQACVKLMLDTNDADALLVGLLLLADLRLALLLAANALFLDCGSAPVVNQLHKVPDSPRTRPSKARYL